MKRPEAAKYLGLDLKTFNNFFLVAKEFTAEPRFNGRGIYRFSKSSLDEWKANFKWRTVSLDRKDYDLCLDFALAIHFKGYVLANWGTATQREFGQKLSNWMRGQLGEVAVKKFLHERFNVAVELDFDIYSSIVEQDVIFFKGRKPKLGIGIKASKPKSNTLILTKNEVEIDTRSSDVYIFCRVDLPDDHLLRISREEVVESMKDQPHFDKYGTDIPHFKDINCEIAGFCYKGELEKMSSVPSLDFSPGYRWVRFSGELHRTESEWKELIDQL